MKNEEIQMVLEGYDSLERAVKIEGGSGGVLLPKIWIGARVKIISITNTYNPQERIYGRDQRKTTIPQKKQIYELCGYESLTRTVKKKSNTAYVILPNSWVGKHVKVILLENPEEKS